MALTPSSSRLSAFDGGTITEALAITPTDTSPVPLRIQGAEGVSGGVDLFSAQDEDGEDVFSVSGDGTASTRLLHGGSFLVSGDAGDLILSMFKHTGSGERRIGFFGATPVAQQTGVAVSAAGIHAALVNLGLITA